MRGSTFNSYAAILLGILILSISFCAIAMGCSVLSGAHEVYDLRAQLTECGERLQEATGDDRIEYRGD